MTKREAYAHLTEVLEDADGDVLEALTVLAEAAGIRTPTGRDPRWPKR